VTAIRLSSPTYPPAFSSGGVSQTATEIDRVVVNDRPLETETGRIGSLISDTGVPPSDHSIRSARYFLRILFARAVKLGSWSKPHITLSENNEIVFEWWHSNKKITLYFGDGGDPEFIKVWGTDIDTDMDSGTLTDDWTLTSLWLWLYS
jgi:hypothetical protein